MRAPESFSAEHVFNAALELTAAERHDFLNETCGLDGDLRSEVAELLRAYDQAADFLQAVGTVSSQLGLQCARPKSEAAGEQIGPYRLLERLGEGGFGTVWVAEQERPIRRRVALKIIKLGMDTEDVVARFELERQALALMDHPNIARVLDAGATPLGRPFFVMELVHGAKITDYCDEGALTIAARLQLFIAVCHAVQHAHQEGIIHPDLKPSNTLVTLHDGVPAPKVIDFGVAKATEQQRFTDFTIYTQLDQILQAHPSSLVHPRQSFSPFGNRRRSALNYRPQWQTG